MKALALQQPWVSLITHGISDTANITKPANHFGKILLVATCDKVADDFFEQIPVEYSATIGNNILMGNLPQLDTLPNNAVIGYADITAELSEITEDTSIWGFGPVMLQLDNVHLFKRPIKLSRSLPKEGTAFDIEDFDEKLLSDSYTPSLRTPHINGTELIIPLSAKYFDEIIALKHKFLNIELADSTIADLLLANGSDKYRLVKFSTVKLVSDDKRTAVFEAQRDSAVQTYTDNDGNPILVPSIWTPDPIEWIVAHISMGKRIN